MLKSKFDLLWKLIGDIDTKTRYMEMMKMV